jgi:5-methylcytosine-specific restriction endonuclease McrA
MNRREWSSRPNRESLSKRNRTLRDFVHARDGACVYCRSKKNLQVDHLVPRSRGGRDDPRQIVSCCRSCNCSRQAKPLLEWERYAMKRGIVFNSADIVRNAKDVEGALKKLLTIA